MYASKDTSNDKWSVKLLSVQVQVCQNRSELRSELYLLFPYVQNSCSTDIHDFFSFASKLNVWALMLLEDDELRLRLSEYPGNYISRGSNAIPVHSAVFNKSSSHAVRLRSCTFMMHAAHKSRLDHVDTCNVSVCNLTRIFAPVHRTERLQELSLYHRLSESQI